jgi:hypothetical protein
VQEITINTIGGVVTSAQELMSIVPIGKLSLQAEVKILNKDVGFVQVIINSQSHGGDLFLF